MTLTIPDLPETTGMSEADFRLELACALYARGKLSKLGGAELSGLDVSSFQEALGQRHIESYSMEMLDHDVKQLQELLSA
jgi:predicted HTH domain antitoxin